MQNKDSGAGIPWAWIHQYLSAFLVHASPRPEVAKNVLLASRDARRMQICSHMQIWFPHWTIFTQWINTDRILAKIKTQPLRRGITVCSRGNVTPCLMCSLRSLDGMCALSRVYDLVPTCGPALCVVIISFLTGTTSTLPFLLQYLIQIPELRSESQLLVTLLQTALGGIPIPFLKLDNSRVNFICVCVLCE